MCLGGQCVYVCMCMSVCMGGVVCVYACMGGVVCVYGCVCMCVWGSGVCGCVWVCVCACVCMHAQGVVGEEVLDQALMLEKGEDERREGRAGGGDP